MESPVIGSNQPRIFGRTSKQGLNLMLKWTKDPGIKDTEFGVKKQDWAEN